MPRRDSRYTTDDTCEECGKTSPHGKGVVGCWIVSNGGTYYSKHKIHHACCQFYPKCGWEAYRHNEKKGQK